MGGPSSSGRFFFRSLRTFSLGMWLPLSMDVISVSNAISATTGLVAADATALADMGLTYTLRYALTDREITGLVPREPAHF